jgi:hypothetical protein
MTSERRNAEEWRAVVGYEGSYEVSGHGRVRSLDRIVITTQGISRRMPGKLIKPSPSGGAGRYRVSLGKGAKVYVHHIVLEAFVGPRPPGKQGLHWDDDPDNNTVGNLYWGTPSENGLDCTRNGRRPPLKTVCSLGHEYTVANTYWTVRQNGRRERHCRICRRRYKRDYQRKVRERKAGYERSA